MDVGRIKILPHRAYKSPPVARRAAGQMAEAHDRGGEGGVLIVDDRFESCVGRLHCGGDEITESCGESRVRAGRRGECGDPGAEEFLRCGVQA